MIKQINQLENGVVEYIMDNAIVRVHPGKLTEEERRVVLEEAARKFILAVQKAKREKGKK